MTLPFPPVWVPFRLNLWLAARLMPAFVKRRDLNRILANATPEADQLGSLPLGPVEIVESVKAVTARPWRMKGRRCLREGLLAFYYLKLSGKHPLLRFGLLKCTLAQTAIECRAVPTSRNASNRAATCRVKARISGTTS